MLHTLTYNFSMIGGLDSLRLCALNASELFGDELGTEVSFIILELLLFLSLPFIVFHVNII